MLHKKAFEGRLETDLGLLYEGAALFSWCHLIDYIYEHFSLILNVLMENYREKKQSKKISEMPF